MTRQTFLARAMHSFLEYTKLLLTEEGLCIVRGFVSIGCLLCLLRYARQSYTMITIVIFVKLIQNGVNLL